MNEKAVLAGILIVVVLIILTNTGVLADTFTSPLASPFGSPLFPHPEVFGQIGTGEVYTLEALIIPEPAGPGPAAVQVGAPPDLGCSHRVYVGFILAGGLHNDR